MEELLEIKTEKEKHMKELEQLQSKYIGEKSVLDKLKKQTAEERRKEEFYKNEKYMKIKTKLQDSRRPKKEERIIPNVLPKLFHSNDVRPGHQNGEFGTVKTRGWTKSGVQEYQNIPKMLDEYNKNVRRRSLEILPNTKKPQQQ